MNRLSLLFRRSIAALAAIAALALLAQCSSSASAMRGDAGGDRSALATEAARDDGEPAGQALPEGRKFIRTAWLTLSAPADAIAAERIPEAKRITESLGGYVQSASLNSLVLKIPTERFDEALRGLSALGEVESQQINLQDVTEQHIDLTARLENNKKLQKRLRELLNETKDVETILKIETELSRVSATVESLENRLRNLDRDAAYSTLHLSFLEAEQPGPLGWVFYGAFRAVKWLFVWD